MILIVNVRAGAKTQEILHQGGHILKIKLRAKPKNGLANRALIKMLSAHFNVPVTEIKIRQGLNRRNKIIEIPDNQIAEELFGNNKNGSVE